VSGSKPQKTVALVVDDGELHVARAVLNQLGVPFTHLRGEHVVKKLPDAGRLLVITARLAVALGVSRTRPKPGEPPFWLAFSPSESKSQRRLLRQAGFDYTIPEQVHPASLRLLMARALYEGENTQRVHRVPFGGEATVVTTLRRHKVVLVDVSPRGCRLLTSKPPKKGSHITLQVPCEEATPLQLEGTVVRTAPGLGEGGRANETAVGVRFDSIQGETREQLKALLSEGKGGPKSYGPTDPPSEAAASPPEQASRTAEVPPSAVDAPAPEAPRVVEDELRVDAFSAGRTRVLVGRDLTEGGMRIDARDGLEVGERLRLALPIVEREEPLIIEAHVARNEGERLLLLFDWMDPLHQARLRQFVGSRAKIRCLEDDTRTHTAVPAALLPQLKRRR